MKLFQRNYILFFLIFSYVFYILFQLYFFPDVYQWDFKSQYHSAKVFLTGGNPYDSETIKSISGTPWWYAYPPATLWFFGLFTCVEYKTAYYIFLFLKIFATVSLVLFWSKKFLGENISPYFLIFLIISFNSALFRDVRAGNINLFEEIFIWLSFYYFLEHRYAPFSFFILLASAFKLTPIFFLSLLLFSPDKGTIKYFWITTVLFVAYLLLQLIFSPDLFFGFLTGASSTLGESGPYSPSTISLLKTASQYLNQEIGMFVHPVILAFVFASISGSLFIFTIRLYRNPGFQKIKDSDKLLLFSFCLIYSIVHPRMKDYAYILLIVPTYWIIKETCYKNIFPFAFFLCILSSSDITLPGFGVFFILIWDYYPLILAYIIWFLYAFEINHRIKFTSVRQAKPGAAC